MKVPIIKVIRTIYISIIIFSIFGLIYYASLPKLAYSLTSARLKDDDEKPLYLSYYQDGIDFNIRIIGRIGEFDTVKLDRKVNFTNRWPFIETGQDLVIRLIDKDGESKQSRVLYILNGSIYDIKKNNYRIRLEDTYKNLIDEKTIDLLSKDPMEDWKICENNNDCISVSCACNCSGCGGFDYQDVINKKYEDIWYNNAKCSKPEVCPQVCCPPRKILCLENECVVIELDKNESIEESTPSSDGQ